MSTRLSPIPLADSRKFAPTTRVVLSWSFLAALPNNMTIAMRRLLSTLILAVLVVGAQQSALVHGIGHGFGRDAASARAADRAIKATGAGTADADAYCEKCFQFAPVMGAVAGHPPKAVWIGTGKEPAQAKLAAAIAADAPLSRSRGPPIFL